MFPLENLLVVIPAFNEEKTIGHLVKRLCNLYPSIEVVVVNDASEDLTSQEALAAGATVIDLPCRLGYWGALQTGFLFGLRAGYEFFVSMDADGQHPPEEIKKLLVNCDKNSSKVIIGSCLGRGNFLKKIAWGFFRFMTGLPVKDLTSGFRLYPRAAIEILADEELLIFDNADLASLIILHKNNFSFQEVPVNIFPRQEGKSKIFASPFKILRYMAFSIILSLFTRKIR